MRPTTYRSVDAANEWFANRDHGWYGLLGRRMTARRFESAALRETSSGLLESARSRATRSFVLASARRCASPPPTSRSPKPRRECPAIAVIQLASPFGSGGTSSAIASRNGRRRAGSDGARKPDESSAGSSTDHRIARAPRGNSTCSGIALCDLGFRRLSLTGPLGRSPVNEEFLVAQVLGTIHRTVEFAEEGSKLLEDRQPSAAIQQSRRSEKAPATTTPCPRLPQ